jgi:hypothetical protein
MNEVESATTPMPPTREERLVMYQVVTARRLAANDRVWQSPGLALTAQAFLMTIGLGPGTGQLARIAAGSLSVIVSLMSIQLLLRHRRHDVVDAQWLEKFELAAGWESIHRPPTQDPRYGKVSFLRPDRYRSWPIWVVGLACFGVVGLIVVVDAIRILSIS